MISSSGTACFANPFTDVLKQLNASDDKQEIATTNEPTDEFTSAQIGALLSVCPGNDDPPLLAFVLVLIPLFLPQMQWQSSSALCRHLLLILLLLLYSLQKYYRC